MLQSLLGLGLAFAGTALGQTACNGNADYCGRSYSDVSFIGAHDSPFVGDLLTDNQNLDITQQLNFGIRFLQGQTHMDLGTLDMCHTSCLLEDAGSLQSFLSEVKEWMDVNPNEVVTLLITNGDSVGIGNFSEAFVGSGISKYAYVPPGSPNVLGIDEWPTLQEMINSGKRLVAFLGEFSLRFFLGGRIPSFPSFLPFLVSRKDFQIDTPRWPIPSLLRKCILISLFIDYGADMSSVPYILDEFAYFFETPYDVTDASFPDCSVNRPAGASPNGRMYIVNHFLDLDIVGILIPDRGAASTTNAATGTGSIGAQSALCESLYSRPPNFVLVDFTDQGNVIAAQNALNGVS